MIVKTLKTTFPGMRSQMILVGKKKYGMKFKRKDKMGYISVRLGL